MLNKDFKFYVRSMKLAVWEINGIIIYNIKTWLCNVTVENIFNQICCISIVQSLFISFVHRWSYGVVLYEIFTIGNIFKYSLLRWVFLHCSGKETEIFQKMNYCNTRRCLRKEKNKQTNRQTKIQRKHESQSCFRCKCSPTSQWKYIINSFLFFKQLL